MKEIRDISLGTSVGEVKCFAEVMVAATPLGESPRGIGEKRGNEDNVGWALKGWSERAEKRA